MQKNILDSLHLFRSELAAKEKQLERLKAEISTLRIQIDTLKEHAPGGIVPEFAPLGSSRSHMEERRVHVRSLIEAEPEGYIEFPHLLSLMKQRYGPGFTRSRLLATIEQGSGFVKKRFGKVSRVMVENRTADEP